MIKIVLYLIDNIDEIVKNMDSIIITSGYDD